MKGFFGDRDQRFFGNIVIVHVALNLHAKVLRGQHQTNLAIPVVDTPVCRRGVERPRRVLVKTEYQRISVLARFDRRVRRMQGTATGGTTIKYMRKLQAAEAHLIDDRIGIAGVLTAAVTALDIAPVDTRIRQRRAGCRSTLL